jgi:hypothetical protein
MMNRSKHTSRGPKWTALALAAGVLMSLGSPVVAVSAAAEEPGLHRPVPVTHGDCKNANSGLHNGYNCVPAEEGGSVEEGGGFT